MRIGALLHLLFRKFIFHQSFPSFPSTEFPFKNNSKTVLPCLVRSLELEQPHRQVSVHCNSDCTTDLLNNRMIAICRNASWIGMEAERCTTTITWLWAPTRKNKWMKAFTQHRIRHPAYLASRALIIQFCHPSLWRISTAVAEYPAFTAIPKRPVK